MLNFILHGIGALICMGVGYYLHYKFGAQVAADVQKVKGIV